MSWIEKKDHRYARFELVDFRPDELWLYLGFGRWLEAAGRYIHGITESERALVWEQENETERW